MLRHQRQTVDFPVDGGHLDRMDFRLLAAVGGVKPFVRNCSGRLPVDGGVDKGGPVVGGERTWFYFGELYVAHRHRGVDEVAEIKGECGRRIGGVPRLPDETERPVILKFAGVDRQLFALKIRIVRLLADSGSDDKFGGAAGLHSEGEAVILPLFERDKLVEKHSAPLRLLERNLQTQGVVAEVLFSRGIYPELRMNPATPALPVHCFRQKILRRQEEREKCGKEKEPLFHAKPFLLGRWK